MVPDLVHKFQMICSRRTEVIEQMYGHGYNCQNLIPRHGGIKTPINHTCSNNHFNAHLASTIVCKLSQIDFPLHSEV